jgi:hypothetical protein
MVASSLALELGLKNILSLNVTAAGAKAQFPDAV